ncbi:TetR/AcrR family transcriptional regulator [Burkholderia catarinensis]|uniref:TetR/AcrR family transcriptional regulator n=1 Tax=Burkholderia catarinensis TaxID=1108140 RepID=UPI000913E6B5|nr:TetR/AcrR family transcriptional regulator [Burkholderia catarinensis]KAG8152576.1 TetR family transcriptional regulator [Burkholderia catarinensis]
MRRKRLTRDETREQTRRRLLDAAASIIAGKGLAAASVEEIAARAGYTRGAFYSNFDSKSELLVELLRLDHRSIQENLRERLDAAPSREDLQKQLAWLHARCYRDDNHYIIWAEARLHAMRDAQFRQRVNAMYLEKRDLIASVIEQLHKRADTRFSCASSDYALAVIALMDGIRYFTMTLPDAPPNASAGSVLSIVFTQSAARPQ